ncbi:MAG: cytochrome c [Bacteroidetes bacterium]|nr:MAG: cytochrome c [Bacteroidota bacterium]
MKYNWLNSFFCLVFLGFMTSCGENTFKQGEMLYKTQCANCHMLDGQGLQSLIPPLAGFKFYPENRAQIACIITNGFKDTIRYNDRIYTEPMEAIPNLTEAEITNIINYINHAWGNDFGYVKISDVEDALNDCK